MEIFLIENYQVNDLIERCYDEDIANKYNTIDDIRSRLENISPEIDNPTELVSLNLKAQEIFRQAGKSTHDLNHTLGTEIMEAINSMNNGARIKSFNKAIDMLNLDL